MYCSGNHHGSEVYINKTHMWLGLFDFITFSNLLWEKNQYSYNTMTSEKMQKDQQ